MKETMRQTLRAHEKRSRKEAPRHRTLSPANRPALTTSFSSPSSSTTNPGAASSTSNTSPSPVRRKPVGNSTPSSRVHSPANSPATRKPVGSMNSHDSADFFGTNQSTNSGIDHTQMHTITAPRPPPKNDVRAGRSGISLPATTSSRGGRPVVPRNDAGFASRAAWEAAEDAYLAQYARRHSGARQDASKKPRRRKGWAQMYREAGPSDGEVLGRWASKGWREWQERRRREDVEREEQRRREYEKRRDEHLVRWLEQGGLGAEEGKALGELAGLKAVSEDEKGDARNRRGDGENHARHHSSSSVCHRSSQSNSVTTPGRAGSSLYGSRTQRTAYVHDETKPDDLDLLVSKVTDKFSQWGKELSEHAAEAKVKKREERQRKTREALKKTISAPQPAEKDSGIDASWAKDDSSRKGVETSSARPSPGSESNTRPMLNASTTSGSMADRMAKRKDGFEVPFWPKSKKEKGKSSAASSAQTSPQHLKYTLPADGDYQRRGTQIGQFMDPELAVAPWNQHVTKANPFSPAQKSRNSTDKDKKSAGGSSKSSPTGNTFFGKLIPSPASLFTNSSHQRSPGVQRRGSDESFFGCVGISVQDERVAQRINGEAHDERQLKDLDFHAPPTPPIGASEPFARKTLQVGGSAPTGGRTPFGVVDSDNDDDADDDDDYSSDRYFFRNQAAQANGGRSGPSLVSPLLSTAQHYPHVSDVVGDRHSVAAELVDQRKQRHQRHTGREPVDDNRVSRWDPSSPSQPMTSKGEESGAAFIPARQEWKVSETGHKTEIERLKFWTDYRENLRGTRDSRDLGQTEGRPF